MNSSPKVASSTSSPNDASTSRFSLLLLEPGEIYFEDYLVYYHELNSPLASEGSHNVQLKGNLKICSKSVVFDPLNFSSPIIKFPYKSIENIELFSKSSDIEKKCFALSTKQTIFCRMNNKISPYQVNKREKTSDKHYFQFIFTDVDSSLDLFLQLHRASTLDDYEQEEVMLELILNSRLKRDLKRTDLLQLEDVGREQTQFESVVNKIEPLVKNPGKILLTNICLYYQPFNNLLDENYRNIKIRLANIKYVIKRRYQLKRIGCEIIFNPQSYNQIVETDSSQGSSGHHKSLPYLYITFEDEATRDQFYTRLVVDQRDKLSSLDEFNQENMLQKWRYGLISNFEYIMYLNNMADRSYNDLTQYPVFPWVLADYKQDVLDLTDNSIFRDLSRPVGALNAERLERLKLRCAEMSGSKLTTMQSEHESSDQPMFLYGTHYSTPAFVSFYLVRQNPEWQLCLQNGRFDHPNRLFHSITDTWKNCLNIDSDVKELIPEFYDTNAHADQLGSFLCNNLELDLGIRQDGSRVNHVILPKWSQNSPKEFIMRMRDALESSYVSENLHNWFDLIFGYKQRGHEALKADNLFYYLCYEGSVDLSSIKNFAERKSLELQIQEFGQIPTQLFNTPHLARVKLTDMIEPSLEELSIEKSAEWTQSYDSSTEKSRKASFKLQQPSFDFKELEVKFSQKLHKSQINDCLFLGRANENKDNTPLICSVSSDNCLKIYSLEDRSLFRSHKVSDFSVSSIDYIQLVDDSDGSDTSRMLLFLSCWDNSVYIYDMNFNRCIHTLSDLHDDAISRVSVLREKSNAKTSYLLTSSWDSMIKLWCMNNRTFKLKFLSEIYHDSACIDFSLSSSYLATICKDGSLHLLNIDIKDVSLDQFENSDDYENDDETDSSKSPFTACFSIQNTIGHVNHCAIIEQTAKLDDPSHNLVNTLAVCTSAGYVKIYNIKTNSELFSLKLSDSALNKVYYDASYLMSVDSSGVAYLIDLAHQQQQQQSDTSSIGSSSASFFTHSIKLGSSSLTSLSVFSADGQLFSVGDTDGNLYVLSAKDF